MKRGAYMGIFVGYGLRETGTFLGADGRTRHAKKCMRDEGALGMQ